MENITSKQIKIARTTSGSPCLWESYVKFDDLKRATVIVDKEGNIKRSIFIRKNGDKQSLIPIDKGDFVIKIFEDKDGVSKSVLEIKDISYKSNHADLLLVFRDTPKEKFGKIENFFQTGIDAAEEKMKDSTFIASILFEKEVKKEYEE